MLKYSRNQFKIIKETDLVKINSMKIFALKFAKLSQINSETFVATEASRSYHN